MTRVETPRTLLVVLSDISKELEADYVRWYDEEHIPQRLAVPGFLRAARFEAGAPVFSGSLAMPEKAPPRHLAIYEMTGPEVLMSEPYRALIASPTEWTRRVRSTFDLRVRGSYVERFRMDSPDRRVDTFREGSTPHLPTHE